MSGLFGMRGWEKKTNATTSEELRAAKDARNKQDTADAAELRAALAARLLPGKTKAKTLSTEKGAGAGARAPGRGHACPPLDTAVYSKGTGGAPGV